MNAWPPAIFQLACLRHLVLHAHSTWARLPAGLGQLSNLETLEVKMAIEGGCVRGFLMEVLTVSRQPTASVVAVHVHLSRHSRTLCMCCQP